MHGCIHSLTGLVGSGAPTVGWRIIMQLNCQLSEIELIVLREWMQLLLTKGVGCGVSGIDASVGCGVWGIDTSVGCGVSIDVSVGCGVSIDTSVGCGVWGIDARVGCNVNSAEEHHCVRYCIVRFTSFGIWNTYKCSVLLVSWRWRWCHRLPLLQLKIRWEVRRCDQYMTNQKAIIIAYPVRHRTHL